MCGKWLFVGSMCFFALLPLIIIVDANEKDLSYRYSNYFNIFIPPLFLASLPILGLILSGFLDLVTDNQNLYIASFTMIHVLPWRKEYAEEECAVCRENYSKKSSCRKTLAFSCDHAFCKRCLKKWLKRHETCPLCRARGSFLKFCRRWIQKKFLKK